MKRLVTGSALGWLCVACVLGAAAACSDAEEPGGGAEAGAAGEGTNGGTKPSGGTANDGGSNANGGTAGNGGSNANAGNGGSNAQAGTTAYGGEGGAQPITEGGAAGAGGVAGESPVAGAGGEAPCTPPPPTLPEGVPELIAAPEGTTLLRHLHAVGTQNYRCTQSAGENPMYTWVLVTPIADLLNRCGLKVGRHYAVEGSVPPIPVWLYEVDGSSVNGARVDASPVEGAIPELLLEQVAHSENGLFSTVTFIQRLDTVGGLAPAANTCDADHNGDTRNVPYTAEYYFYSGGD